ncbi:MAG: acyl-[acyl-carrier-protein] thioesterase [Clostridiales bacterium]|jgi:acyl-ACP thioesterase|nr:acyl-[acyl-carrier-protein] thioesterase [Clostridiales bacterium]
MAKFSNDYSIDYRSVDIELRATFPSLMRLVQETSTLHSESTPYKMSWYAKEKMAWVLSSWNIEAKRYPLLRDNVTVSTFPTKFMGSIGERGFEMISENGELILAAHSVWVFYDLEKGKFALPPKELAESYGEMFPQVVEKKIQFPLLSREPEKFELETAHEFEVTRRDIDSNAHVNNISYIEWAFDGVPEELCQACRATRTHASYKKQLRLGDRVKAEFYKGKENPLLQAAAFKNPDGSLVAEAHSLWSEKSAF